MNVSFEKLVFGNRASFLCREFKLKAFDSPLHFHPEVELTAIISGRGQRFVGDHVAPYQAGDLVLLGANLPHYWHSDPSSEELSHSIVIQFQHGFFQNAFFEIPELQALKELMLLAQRGLRITGQKVSEIRVKMKALLGLGGPSSVVEVLQLLELVRSCEPLEPLASPGFAPHADVSGYTRINKVCQYVFDHFAEPINSPDAASLLGMSLPSFCQFFKKNLGRSFTTFVNEVRIGQACKLLMETDRSISEIAYHCGYNNLSNFNRRFKEINTLSPQNYRKRLKALG